MIPDYPKHPHAYAYLLTDDLKFPFAMIWKGLIKKKQYFIEFSNTVDLINKGMRDNGEKYLGSFDHFYFELPEPIELLSKVTYDELVAVWRWRHENDLQKVGDYDDAVLFGNNISKYSLLSKKSTHINSELTTLYPFTKDPRDPDYNPDETAEFQMGPPWEAIGPNGKPFGDFMMRLVYDSILIQLKHLYTLDNKKDKDERKLMILKTIQNYENFTKLPEFEMNKLVPIINALVKN